VGKEEVMLVSMSEEAYNSVLHLREEFKKVRGKGPGKVDRDEYMAATGKMLNILAETDFEEYVWPHDRPNGEE
jgi:hypothetical protein